MCQMFKMQRFQRPDNHWRDNEQEEKAQKQTLQDAGKMEDALGSEKEIKINAPVKA
jgi:hypothetical protein